MPGRFVSGVASTCCWLAAALSSGHAPPAPASAASPVVLSGSVRPTAGKAAPHARVSLSYYTADGKLVWRSPEQLTTGDGRFQFHAGELAVIPGVRAAVITATVPGFLTGKQDVVVDIQGAAVQVAPSAVSILVQPYSRWLTLFFTLPALIGIVLTVMHLTRVAEGVWVTYLYALGGALTWLAAVAGLTVAYLASGHELIPLFFPDAFLNSGVVVFAFFGTFTYAAYSVYQRRSEFFSPAAAEARRRLLLTMGGRIWIAPYVAATAYGVLTLTFPNLLTGGAANFFGFFTGLYIKVVLDALNDIGTRFLSAESTQRAAQLLARDSKAAPAPGPSAAPDLPPAPGFLEALAAARQQLIAREGVIGVAAGVKQSATDPHAGQPAIVAYVYEKKPLPPGDPNAAPETFMGVPVDVREVPAPAPGETCRGVFMDLSWPKIHAGNQQRLAAAPPGANPVHREGDVLVLTGAGGARFFFDAPRNGTFFDAIGAFKSAREGFPPLGRDFDFVAFLVDWEILGRSREIDYCIPVFNDAAGIGFYRDPNPQTRFDDRPAWGGPFKLRSCQVHFWAPPLETCLHEIGHTWTAYANPGSRLSTDGHHWSEAVDDGFSCMDHDGRRWVQKPGTNLFRQEPIQPDEFSFCELDLYLMGFLEPEKVRPVRVLTQKSARDQDGFFEAKIETVPIASVQAACGGPRMPPAAQSQKSFRQAFVVVSGDQNEGLRKARLLGAPPVSGGASFLKSHEESFRRATRVATLSTGLA